eukprot:170631_1
MKNNQENENKSAAVQIQEIGFSNISAQGLILKALHKKFYPTKFEFVYCDKVKNIFFHDTTQYWHVGVRIARYKHIVTAMNITCPEMLASRKNGNQLSPYSCNIYRKMTNDNVYCKQHLQHLNEYIHFADEYKDKPQCKFLDECYAYQRLQNGGNKIKDHCHMKLFRHPPRRRQIELQENVHAFIMHKNVFDNHQLFDPSYSFKTYKWNKKDGFLKALIQEVIGNGYQSDLYLTSDCVDDVNEEKKSDYSIMEVVDEKLLISRHKRVGSPLNRAEMLALVLYTSCNCNYDLCKSQRNDDYDKWKWFDYCLYHA